jgi:hypothetical protein
MDTDNDLHAAFCFSPWLARISDRWWLHAFQPRLDENRTKLAQVPNYALLP